MSRTDKDRPHWVIRHTENYPIEHDHKGGACVEETLKYARDYNAGAYRSGYRHSCLKRLEYEYYCTEAEPFRVSRYSWSKGRSWRPSGETVCWGEYQVFAGYGSSYPLAMRTKKNGCLGPHKRWEHVDTIPCVCNGWPVAPTCNPAWYGDESGWTYSSSYRPPSMSERTHTEWHGPERRREREAGRDWVKAWNSGDDLDDWDFENRQARGEALWHAM